MAIIQMKKAASACCFDLKKDEILKELMLLGCVQVSELNAEQVSGEIGVELSRDNNRPIRIQSQPDNF